MHGKNRLKIILAISLSLSLIFSFQNCAKTQYAVKSVFSSNGETETLIVDGESLDSASIMLPQAVASTSESQDPQEGQKELLAPVSETGEQATTVTAQSAYVEEYKLVSVVIPDKIYTEKRHLALLADGTVQIRSQSGVPVQTVLLPPPANNLNLNLDAAQVVNAEESIIPPQTVLATMGYPMTPPNWIDSETPPAKYSLTEGDITCTPGYVISQDQLSCEIQEANLVKYPKDGICQFFGNDCNGMAKPIQRDLDCQNVPEPDCSGAVQYSPPELVKVNGRKLRMMTVPPKTLANGEQAPGFGLLQIVKPPLKPLELPNLATKYPVPPSEGSATVVSQIDQGNKVSVVKLENDEKAFFVEGQVFPQNSETQKLNCEDGSALELKTDKFGVEYGVCNSQVEPDEQKTCANTNYNLQMVTKTASPGAQYEKPLGKVGYWVGAAYTNGTFPNGYLGATCAEVAAAIGKSYGGLNSWHPSLPWDLDPNGDSITCWNVNGWALGYSRQTFCPANYKLKTIGSDGVVRDGFWGSNWGEYLVNGVKQYFVVENSSLSSKKFVYGVKPSTPQLGTSYVYCEKVTNFYTCPDSTWILSGNSCSKQMCVTTDEAPPTADSPNKDSFALEDSIVHENPEDPNHVPISLATTGKDGNKLLTNEGKNRIGIFRNDLNPLAEDMINHSLNTNPDTFAFVAHGNGLGILIQADGKEIELDGAQAYHYFKDNGYINSETKNVVGISCWAGGGSGADRELMDPSVMQAFVEAAKKDGLEIKGFAPPDGVAINPVNGNVYLEGANSIDVIAGNPFGTNSFNKFEAGLEPVKSEAIKLNTTYDQTPVMHQLIQIGGGFVDFLSQSINSYAKVMSKLF